MEKCQTFGLIFPHNHFDLIDSRVTTLQNAQQTLLIISKLAKVQLRKPVRLAVLFGGSARRFCTENRNENARNSP